ncbi:murein hydrolase activator EnvC family protein [Pelagovum pacificum]|uniref:Peptidase M23 n=1 Tax=Pelagovum pacificum TaxID=2588711 RepID=A0A5C5GJ28_9RHOB|nr:peptidoglycan DD-metalloendopeptidase family protein [Pelagovum pacificum]QQA42635.1 peptidoglycan DD-metalloendopeptidase family protein [Pelagovum pacificum]TNY34214.1 peptidase M23 [Pelagovum pacificum]
MIRALALCLTLMASGVSAQSDPATAADAAATRLDRAAQMLADARTGSDRVAALTETVRAYEDGLVAMREGLRRASIRERTLSIQFEARRDELSRLLGILSTISNAPTPLLLLHPTGPTGTARSGMILADVAPALQRDAEQLRAELEELELLRTLQASASDTLEEGLQGAQEARTALSQAIADRVDLPRRYVEDGTAMRDLIESTETLSAFASGLSGTVAMEVEGAPQPDVSARRGTLSMPVEGTLIRGYQEADAAGVTRPGWLIATRPEALVTTPAVATMRYAGPLLDYGNVVILEPGSGVLFVFAGLGEVYGEVGEVIPEGAPIGLMGGAAPDIQAILTDSVEGADASRSETLYVEIRDGQDTVDPAEWFVPMTGSSE